MGILSKIEDKLGGSQKDEEQNDGLRPEGRTDNYTSSTSGEPQNRLQHPIGAGTSGTGITGGTAVDKYGSSGLTGSQDTRQYGRESSNLPGSFPGESGYGNNNNNTTAAAAASGVPDRTRGGHVTSTNTSTVTRVTGSMPGAVSGSNTDHNTPRQPYDPYSSKGQQIAANAADDRNTLGASQGTYGTSQNPRGTSQNVYGASQNRAAAGDTGSRRHHDDSAVPRTQGGGVSNQLQSGPHSDLENRDAVPTAGGQKIGTGSAYDSPSHGQPQQHHYGRDSAVVGGTGAAGYGAYEATQGRSDAGRGVGSHTDTTNVTDSRAHADSNEDKRSKTVGPHNSDLMNKLDPRVESNPEKAYDDLGSKTSEQAYGSQGQTSTSQGYGTLSQTAGSPGQGQTAHNSGLLNKSDRRIESNPEQTYNSQGQSVGDREYGQSTTSHGYGSQDQTTASQGQPVHNSSVLNKLDPRVDSNPEQTSGSRGQTYDSQHHSTSSRDQNPGYEGYGPRDPLNTTSTTGTQHHYGRDAGLAGGAGAVSQYTSRSRDPADANTTPRRDQPIIGSAHTSDPTGNKFGQDISYMNRPSADQPLSHSRDFHDRHSTASNTTTGVGAAQSGQSQPYGNNSSSTSGRGAAGSLLSSRHADYETSRKNWAGGAYGAGYETGYDAGYRDALAHVEAQRATGRF